VGDGSGRVTIDDNDVPLTVSINDTTVVEPDTGSVSANLTIALSGPATQVITVNYATQDNTATAGVDYEAKLETVTFQIGETEKQVSFNVLGDLDSEPEEEFNVLLSNVTGATVGDGSGRVTIEDNDSTLTLSISDAAVIEGTSGTVNAVFVVRLSAASSQAVSVMAATADDTATADLDYTARSQLIEFAPGVTSGQFTVTVNGETIPEGLEKFFVNLSSPSGATIDDTRGIGLINEIAPSAPWQNTDFPMDANRDGLLADIDFQIIIDHLDANGAHILAPPGIGDLPPYLDVNGNNKVTPLDVLIVIHARESQGLQAASASDQPAAVMLLSRDDAVVAEPMFAAASADEPIAYVVEQPVAAMATLTVHECESTASETSAGRPVRLQAIAVDAVVSESASGLARRPSQMAAADDLFECGYGSDA
jgi:hypothetical protein